MKCSKTSWYTAVLTLDLRKHSGPTPADDMAPQTITDCGNFTLDLKQRGFCASPLFLQTLGPWFPKEMQNLLSSENITLDHSAAVQSLWISTTFLNGFCFTILSRVRLSLLLVHFFSTTSFPSLRLSINVLGHRALWTASLFCNDLLCLALLVQGVNCRLLDNCQVSSLPHDCVAYRTRLRDHLKAFAGVLS